MNNKKTRKAIISVVALLLVIIGVTYAYWLVTKTQTNSNIISSACLDISLTNEANDISLSSQYPLADEEGMKLTPYTFTVTNNCNTSIDYQVVLESIGEESTAIKASALKVALDTKADLLSNRAPVTTTVSGAYAAHRLGYGTLSSSGSKGSSRTHSLRIWIDEAAPISESNKSYEGKISVTVGQGIKAPVIKEGSLAYDILANNSESEIPEIDITDRVDRILSSGDVLIDGRNDKIYYGTAYTYDEVSNEYILGGETIQASLDECRNGTKTCGKYTFKHERTRGTTLYEIIDFGTSSYYVTANTIEHTTLFALPTTIDDAGLYKSQDDLGTSYYYRGAVTNNYVQFGTYAANTTVNGTTNNEETPMYWRIVRINGDGTIRLVYDGTIKAGTGTVHNTIIGDSTYNLENHYNANYGDSDIKGVVDSWYNTHLKTNYGGYIADGIFCNDKEVTEVYYYDENESETDAENAVWLAMYYAPTERLDKSAPQLTCTRKEDRYTKTTELGNGQLTHPVGLLTADEVMFAGGINENYYLYSGDRFLTSSPKEHNDVTSMNYIWGVSKSGSLTGVDTYYDDPCGVRPVINLRADVEFTGDGSFDTPYVIKTN